MLIINTGNMFASKEYNLKFCKYVAGSILRHNMKGMING